MSDNDGAQLLSFRLAHQTYKRYNQSSEISSKMPKSSESFGGSFSIACLYNFKMRKIKH